MKCITVQTNIICLHINLCAFYHNIDISFLNMKTGYVTGGDCTGVPHNANTVTCTLPLRLL